MTIEGIIAVLKPVNYTSHDVVAVMRRILRIKRIGHTGTLDPMVTGVLPLCIGRATRLVEYIQELPKEYEAVLKLGIATDTEDLSGKIIEQVEEVNCSKDDIKKVISSFIGTIEQIPPMYSAVKVQGKRLYELARLGQEVERKSRSVHIHSIQLIHMDFEKPHPEVKIKVLCSKGTYIRTLCVDIGKALGYPALMSELVRTATGNIHIEQCLSLPEIEQLHKENKLTEHVIPMDKAISHIPAFYIDKAHKQRALQGQKIDLSYISPFVDTDHVNSVQQPYIRLYSQEPYFLGIFMIDLQNNVLKPVKVFEDCR